jgi:hypothetical protein
MLQSRCRCCLLLLLLAGCLGRRGCLLLPCCGRKH